MDPSTNNIVSLYPERRANKENIKKDQTVTSQYFAPSQQTEKPTTPTDDADKDLFAKMPRRDGRQTVLSFNSNGKLKTKAPLTNPTPRSDTRRLNLSTVASETISLLPGLLATRPDVGTAGHLHAGTAISPLTPADPHPNLLPATICVLDADTIDVALAIPPSTHPTNTKPPLILNMANAAHAGGGFKHGALAQEEALCYRSSLFFTLKLRHYPLPDLSVLYSPKILVIRASLAAGHQLLDLRDPAQLPVLSVISVAAVCIPALKTVSDGNGGQKQTYAKGSDRELMREKMRTVLRVAVREGHTRVVLGALGCGAFRNPNWEVAELWRAVLGEQEFAGRWEEVVFAVLGKENFEVFDRVLTGMRV